MPKYLRIVTVINGRDNIGFVFKAKPGAISSSNPDGYSKDCQGFDNIRLDCFLPATEEEYLSHKTK